MKTSTVLRAAFLGAVMTALFVISAGAASVGVGTVNTDSGLRLREEADKGSGIVATANVGDRVTVLEEPVGGWCKVDYQTRVGYMSAIYLDIKTDVEADLGYGVVNADGGVLNVREGSGTGFKKVTSVPDHTPLKLEGFTDGWYKVTYNGKTGYVSSDYIILTLDAKGTRKDGQEVKVIAPAAPATSRSQSQQSQQQAAVPAQATSSVTVEAGSGLGAKAVAVAKQYLGCPYRSGGKGPYVFDCSGFVQYVYKQLGYRLPAGSTTQWKTIQGQRIYSMAEMQPGDLFFICNPRFSGGRATSHVGIYIGNGQFIHASTTGYYVMISSIYEAPYGPYFVGAIRLG